MKIKLYVHLFFCHHVLEPQPHTSAHLWNTSPHEISMASARCLWKEKRPLKFMLIIKDEKQRIKWQHVWVLRLGNKTDLVWCCTASGGLSHTESLGTPDGPRCCSLNSKPSRAMKACYWSVGRTEMWKHWQKVRQGCVWKHLWKDESVHKNKNTRFT